MPCARHMWAASPAALRNLRLQTIQPKCFWSDCISCAWSSFCAMPVRVQSLARISRWKAHTWCTRCRWRTLCPVALLTRHFQYPGLCGYARLWRAIVHILLVDVANAMILWAAATSKSCHLPTSRTKFCHTQGLPRYLEVRHAPTWQNSVDELVEEAPLGSAIWPCKAPPHQSHAHQLEFLPVFYIAWWRPGESIVAYAHSAWSRSPHHSLAWKWLTSGKALLFWKVQRGVLKKHTSILVHGSMGQDCSLFDLSEQVPAMMDHSSKVAILCH